MREKLEGINKSIKDKGRMIFKCNSEKIECE